VGGAILVGTLLVYAPALGGGFVWDDDAHVTRPELRDARGLVKIWSDPSATQQYYPLTHTGFWLQSILWSERPGGYHAVNVVLHALSAVMVWTILRRLEVPGALLAAAIFALHPVHVESVAWITELKNALSGFFYLAAALAWLEFDPPDATSAKARDLRWWAAAFALFLCALLSKTVTASLPAAVLLVTWWRRGRLSWKRDVVPLIPFFVIGAAMGLVTAWIERNVIGARGEDYALSLIERGLVAGRAFWFYLGKLVWPADLIFIYPRWTIDATAWWQYLYPLAAVALAGAAWALRHRIGRGPVTGLLFFGGTLFPVLGFVNVYPFQFSYVADHFQYLPSLGIIAMVAWGIATALNRVGAGGRPAGALVCIVLLAALGWLSFKQCHIYEDAETLWVDTTTRNPGSFMAFHNLGFEYSRQGRYAEAEEAYASAIAVKPDFARTYFNLGRLYARQGKPDRAIAMYHRAIELRPGDADAHYNLGIVLGGLGRHAEAVPAFEAAIEAQPDFADAHYSLGSAHGNLGHFTKAAIAFETAFGIRPDYPEARYGLGIARVGLGDRDGAADAFLAAGNLFGRRGHYVEALDAFRRALAQRPDDAEAWFRMGVAYARLGRSSDAASAWEAAVRLDPEGEYGTTARESIAGLEGSREE
jgi:tetratricopeptide (TPR) repeat protein